MSSLPLTLLSFFLQAKSESTIARLEAELNELKIFHRKELDKLNHKADQATKESKELRNQLREKEQVGITIRARLFKTNDVVS